MDDNRLVILGGHKIWLLGEKVCRDDGPAIILDNGSKFWWIEGELISQRDWFILLLKKYL